MTVDPKQVANDQRENMKVVLTATGSIYSWFKLLPRYKINREGDSILTGTEIYLSVVERENERIHCSEKGIINHGCYCIFFLNQKIIYIFDLA